MKTDKKVYEFKKGSVVLIDEIEGLGLRSGQCWEWFKPSIGTVKITKNVKVTITTKISD